jgi:hypothetical protein
MGRMFGSTRFMAPEELELGALINEQTNVFAMLNISSACRIKTTIVTLTSVQNGQRRLAPNRYASARG